MPEDYGGEPASARRKFERDKGDLADLGFPLGYDAVRNLYSPPVMALRQRRLLLGGAEAAVVRIALAVAAGDPASPLRTEANGCLARLARATAPPPVLPGLAPSRSVSPNALPVQVHHPTRESAPHLHDALRRFGVAIRRRLPTTFTYEHEAGPRRGGGRRRWRAVEPWGLFAREGRWYLVGFDRDRQAERTFRVAEIDRLHVEGLPDGAPRFVRPPEFDIAAVAERRPWDFLVHAPVEARLRVDPVLAESAVRALGGDARAEGEVVVRTVTYAAALEDFAWERMPRVRPEAPERLVEAWRKRLARIAARHV